MRAVSLLLAPLAAPLFFASPADSAFLPACCVSDGSVEPEDAPPIFVGAKVRRPDELALEANVEEPRPRVAPLADAIAIPDKDEGLPRIIAPPPPIPVVADDDAAPKRDIDNPNTEPCCGPAEAEPEDPPAVFAGANVRSPDEREQVAMAEAPIPDEVSTADAIGTLLNELPELPAPVREPIIAEGDSAPVTGGMIDLSGCCQPEKTKTHPPDRHPEEDVTPPLVGAKVRNPEKQGALEAAAEAPITSDAPLVDAIGIPLEKRRGVSEPEFRPVTAVPTAPALTAQGPGIDDHGPPCCTAVEPEDPFEFVGAKAKNRHERTLEATAEFPVPTKAPRAGAIAIPLDEPPAVPEPARVPITLLLVLVILLTIGLFRPWRRRGLREDEAVPPMRPLPDELAWSGTAAAPQPEPEVVLARAKAKARELEPA